MSITLSKIANNSASVSIQYGEDTITLEYYPGRITEKTFASMDAFAASSETSPQDAFADFNVMLCNLLKSWDIYEDDASTIMYPIDPAHMADLPFALRVKTVQAMMNDLRPEE